MKITNTIRISLAGLKANKLRSALTILGIVIGITSIILVVSIGNGAQGLILGEIQSMGSRTLTVEPGKPSGGLSDSMMTFFQQSLKENDLESLKKKANVPHLQSIIPIVFTSDNINFGNEVLSATILGSSEKIFDFYKIIPAEGSLFTEDDVKGKTDNCVIGSKIKEKLFGNIDPVGQKIRVKNKTLRIVGVLPEKGGGFSFNYNSAIMAPYTTIKDYVLSQKYYNEFIVEVDQDKYIDQTVQDIQITLRNNHNITDPEKDDFNVQTQKDLMKTVGTVTTVMTLFLALVAAISLLVGGVGIMNVMFISVTERTKEIGLRKALGATNSDILNQFLFEAIYLTLAGGLLGILFGSLFSYVASIGLSQALSSNWAFSFPISAALMGIGVSAFIGVVFGIYPAYSASKKNPIEALRYE
ncbi:MAG TPA: ABC transporter permease [Patescibacteria group bacterium]|nr:ABC transporter permease [Patescibacteria group bacterium]